MLDDSFKVIDGDTPQWWAQLSAVDDTPQPMQPDEFTRVMYAERRGISMDAARVALDRLIRCGKIERVRMYKKNMLYRVVK